MLGEEDWYVVLLMATVVLVTAGVRFDCKTVVASVVLGMPEY